LTKSDLDGAPPGRERVLLVGIARSHSEVDEAEDSLDELAQLAETAGGVEVERVVQVRGRPDPATYIGSGKAKEIVQLAKALDADAIIFDDELAPAQGRNLEDLAGVNPLAPSALKIVDRTGLILDVFAQHAHSAEGKLQVELAQIDYMLPRLRGWGEVMSRLGAGIGTRGPGETKLEADRRRINRRLSRLKRDLSSVERTRRVKRQKRVENGVTQVCLVGYTNAGKSTLLNSLTGAGVVVEDRLFSTLDPTSRRLRIPEGREVVITDTVGFVRKLPHQLVEAFRSTLEDASISDLLVHVVDLSSANPALQIQAVEDVLREIGAATLPRILAYNKADLVTPSQLDELEKNLPSGIFISARNSSGLEELMTAMASRLSAGWVTAKFLIPFDRGDLRSLLFEEGQVIEEESGADGTSMLVRTKIGIVKRLGDFVQVADVRPAS
jgi:GTP-binding protein HflX